ncbi:MAG TPA: hypothetical protein VG388_15410 [Solirubrobacteraceae bacterium]|jgi:hypothetical protein|nr:hypothetical protein [Solirubrobacteraceae bacterium]
MTDRQLMPVQVEVIKQVLVDRILTEVLERYPGEPVAAVADALGAELDLPVGDGGALDLRMRRIGYLSRIVESEMFEPARHPVENLAEDMTQRLAVTGDWSAAAAALSVALAREEPLPKPQPTDERATSWKIPGPGGHVRHFIVAAAIAECMSGDMNGDGALPEGVDDAAELKRCWMYGFLVRCCEEASPPG